MDVKTLTELLREAEEHHGSYEASAPAHHWSDWYAAYIVSRAAGHSSEKAVSDAGKHMEAVLG
ncbi:bleomycin resistance protein [Streptomyces sp. NPDC051020]|uniref:bleomycin resistance protein n=1 Tax=Streptomyces sp. NPDC051020 TaxID=3155409 RepID=UPI003446A279